MTGLHLEGNTIKEHKTFFCMCKDMQYGMKGISADIFSVLSLGFMIYKLPWLYLCGAVNWPLYEHSTALMNLL